MAGKSCQEREASLHDLPWSSTNGAVLPPIGGGAAVRGVLVADTRRGIVISELEFMGRTTAATEAPTPLRTFGRPRLNQILDALAHDFRRWSKDRD